jgi:hypothetical protein
MLSKNSSLWLISDHRQPSTMTIDLNLPSNHTVEDCLRCDARNGQRHAAVYQDCADHGGIAQFKLLGKPYLLVTDPDYVRYILQDISQLSAAGVERPHFRNGLPLIDGILAVRTPLFSLPSIGSGWAIGIHSGMCSTFSGLSKSRDNELDMDDEMMT